MQRSEPAAIGGADPQLVIAGGDDPASDGVLQASEDNLTAPVGGDAVVATQRRHVIAHHSSSSSHATHTSRPRRPTYRPHASHHPSRSSRSSRSGSGARIHGYGLSGAWLTGSSRPGASHATPGTPRWPSRPEPR